MKKTIIRIIIILAFAACVILACNSITPLLLDKQPGNIYQMKALKAQDKNSIDLLVIGSSRVFNDVYPDVFWEKYGISSYDLATPSQLPRTGLYCLKEALRTQKPKLVIYEVSIFDEDKEYDDCTEGRFVQNGVRYLGYSLEDRKNGIRPGTEDYFSYPNYLSLLACYHANYDRVTKEDAIYNDFTQFPKTGIKGYKGEVSYTHAVTLGAYPDEMTVRETPLGVREKYYLGQILKTVRDSGAELLLVNSPDHDLMDFPAIEEWSQENQVKFINFNYLYDETQILPDEDFIEKGHLNRYGGIKYTSCLADIVKENYDLPDHRGDERYYSYEENAHYEHLLEQNAKIKKITGLGDYFSYLPCDDYITVIQLVGDYDAVDVGQQSVLSKFGIIGPNYENGGTYVFDGIGTLMFSTWDEIFDWQTDIGKRTLSISVDEKGKRLICIDGKDYVYKPNNDRTIKNGVEVILYDKLNQQVVDSIAFDVDDNWAMIR